MRLSVCLAPLALLSALCACDDAPRQRAASQQAASPTPTAPAPAAAVPTPPAAPPITVAGSSGAAPRALPRDAERLPLARILQIAQKAVPGEVIDAELDDDDDIPEYEVKILTPEGRSMEVKIDARRGTILEVEED